jgi:2-dehydropantoate 2-reductase
MDIAVLGPGGVGGLLGGLLARQGDAVTCVAGEETVALLRERGLRVRSAAFGDFTVPVKAATVLDEPVDACLVTIKATQLDEALERVPREALGEALLVPFLNGVEHVAALRERYPPDQVVAGTIRVESSRVSPGEIEHRSPFARIELVARGPLAGRVAALADHLASAGPEVTVTQDEQTALWGKLSFLAPLALVSTHAGGPLGVARGERRGELLSVIGEIVEVARVQGVELDEQAIVAFVDQLPGDMKPSMLRDAEAGRPLEVEAIGGSVVRAAERAGIEVPVTASLVADLRVAEQRTRSG